MIKISCRLCIFLFFALLNSSFAKTVEADRAAIAELKEECSNNKIYLVDGEYDVECGTLYQHYNSNSDKQYSQSLATRNGKVRIGGFNLWHPGSQNSGYKDYKLIAKIINNSDIVGALELLPLVSLDAKNNKEVVDAINEGPAELRSLKKELSQANRNGDLDKVQALKAKIAIVTDTISKAPSLYRSPGYLKVLSELRKLDSSWSLILSPRGDSAKPTHVKELTGFYYRGRSVKPITNEHCQETYSNVTAKKYACFPNLRASFMGRETSHVFSRRPLLASFKSGNFDFSILASHVVFTSPHPVEDREDMENILRPSFGVSDYKDLGVGLDSTNYARFAEAKILMELMEKLKKNYKEKDVMYVGDMNLTADNPYWSNLLKETGEHELLIDVETSLSLAKENSRGIPTNAMASNYDHFILPKNGFLNCRKSNDDYDTSRLKYLEGYVYDYISENYIVRSKRIKDQDKEIEQIYPEDEELGESMVSSLDYQLTKTGERQMNKMLTKLKSELNKVYTIKKGEIVKDDSKIEQRLNYFRDRVFLSQLSNNTFYRVYKEIISDHYPISMSCSNK
ncbi:hypothetical protein [Halobacteriovorax sp. JY17]|uniref:hypothetical protein n=1 Tax=Halobacteriovorax sp. JY17 TaxID=2014617 RepID=UPI000C3E7B45|nr:hypothetical protein [Halobacteriovorax sp. JY17]PIK13800.1 MAG: hypothetical protein CES88_12490 [Halobacteriovorax sp. JY17]